MKGSKLEKGRGYAYDLEYHIAWCVKERQTVFDHEEWKSALADVLYSIAGEKGFTIEMMDINEDYIHILVRCKPQHYIPDIIKALKGISARKLQHQIPELQNRLEDEYHIWDTSYMVVAGSDDVLEKVEAYISNYKIYRTSRK